MPTSIDPKIAPKTAPKTAPKAASKAAPKVAIKVAAKKAPKVALQAASKVAPKPAKKTAKAAPSVTPVVAVKAARKAAAKVAAKVVAKKAPKAAPATEEKPARKTAAKKAPKAAATVTAKVEPKAAARSRIDTAYDATFDDFVVPEAPVMAAPPAPPVKFIDPFLERPSKTARKKESHDLQELGEAAVALPDSRLVGLDVSEVLLDAINNYKKTKTFEGKRRQMQYIGKLMRSHDVDALRQAVTDMQLGRAKDSLALHQAERWRAEMVSTDDALTRWTAAHPQTDVQQLRSLIRAARKDAAQAPEKRSGRAYRELFQFLRESMANE